MHFVYCFSLDLYELVKRRFDHNKSLVSLAKHSQSRLNSFQTVKTLFCIVLPGHLDFISFLDCALFLAGDWPQTTIPNELKALSLGIVVWGQSPAKNRAQPRKEMKSRCPGKIMQKRVFTVWNEFSLDWLCVARLTRLLLWSKH